MKYLRFILLTFFLSFWALALGVSQAAGPGQLSFASSDKALENSFN